MVIRLAGVSGRPGLPVDGTIRIRSLKNVVYVGRPVFGQPDGSGALFKFEPDGAHATRVTVRFGAASVNSIQILDGLRPGDCVILSDMRAYEGNDRIRVK